MQSNTANFSPRQCAEYTGIEEPHDTSLSGVSKGRLSATSTDFRSTFRPGDRVIVDGRLQATVEGLGNPVYESTRGMYGVLIDSTRQREWCRPNQLQRLYGVVDSQDQSGVPRKATPGSDDYDARLAFLKAQIANLEAQILRRERRIPGA